MEDNVYYWDVFISHASEDKETVAIPLAETLAERGLRVWIDKQQLAIGDSLRRKIDEGLSKSRFGVVILSKGFFAKEWAKKELDALVSREDGRAKVILPVWHEVSKEDVAFFSPMLADKYAVSTSDGLGEVVERIVREVRPYKRIQSMEIPKRIFDMFYDHHSSPEEIVAAVQSLGFSRDMAKEWVNRWYNTIAHGND